MSLRSPLFYCLPDETARVARAAFPRGNPYLRMYDALGPLFAGPDFADLYPGEGQPAVDPALLALVTIFQFVEGLPDRQAADAVRGRIDWKYALCLPLEDEGFDASVLSEFRARLIAGGAERRLLRDAAGAAQGRSAGQAARAAADRLDPCAGGDPGAQSPGVSWARCCATRSTRWPAWPRTGCAPGCRRPGSTATGSASRTTACRKARPRARRWPRRSGPTGGSCWPPSATRPRPPGCGRCPPCRPCWRCWLQQFHAGDPLRWRAADGSAARAAPAVTTPYDPEARYSRKRAREWIGYKVHLTETCDEDGPHLITDVADDPGPRPGQHRDRGDPGAPGRARAAPPRAPRRRGLRRRGACW